MNKFTQQAKKLFPFYFILSIWLVHILKEFTLISLKGFGVHPRHFNEWYTFFTGAFIHSDWQHLANNTYPLIICGIFIFFLFEKYSNQVFILSFLLSGLFTFLFARGNTYHIGASGVAYSWAFLLAASGLFRKDRLSLGLGLLVVMLYGSMIWGVLPIQEGISWDGHLYGAISGIAIAYLFKNVNVKKKIESITNKTYQFNRYNYGNFAYINKQKKKPFYRHIDERLVNEREKEKNIVKVKPKMYSVHDNKKE